MKTFAEHMAKIERIVIKRAYKLYYGKELDYKAHLEEIRKEQSGTYFDELVKQEEIRLTELIECENKKGFTNVVDKFYDYDDLKMRDHKHILDQVAEHFNNIGLKAQTHEDSIYYVIEIKW